MWLPNLGFTFFPFLMFAPMSTVETSDTGNICNARVVSGNENYNDLQTTLETWIASQAISTGELKVYSTVSHSKVNSSIFWKRPLTSLSSLASCTQTEPNSRNSKTIHHLLSCIADELKICSYIPLTVTFYVSFQYMQAFVCVIKISNKASK